MSEDKYEFRPLPLYFNPPESYHPPSDYRDLDGDSNFPNLNAEDYRVRNPEKDSGLLPYYEHIDQTNPGSCILLGTNSYVNRYYTGNIFGFEEFDDLAEEDNRCRFRLNCSGTVTGLKHISDVLFILTSSCGYIEIWSTKSPMRNPNDYCLFKIGYNTNFEGTATDLQIFKDENKAITSSTYKIIRVWDYGASDLIPTLIINDAHADSITGVSLNPNCNRSFVTCSKDESVLMWDVKSPMPKSSGIYEFHGTSFEAVHWGAENETGGIILAGDSVGCIQLFDIRAPQKKLTSFKVGKRGIRKIKFNGKNFAVLNGTQYLRVYEYQKADVEPKMVFEFSSGGAIIYDCLWDLADDKFIYLVGEDKYFKKVKIDENH